MTFRLRPPTAAIALVATCFVAAPATAQVVELTENFTTATQAAGGWTLTSGFWPAQNNSTNPQPFSATGGAWGPGATLFSPAPGNGYFATDTTATGTNNGTVSDWLLTPVISLHNGDTLKFATRTRSPEEGPSRLEVRLSTGGASSNVGTLPSDVGAFTTLVGTINPNLTANLYPTSWAAGIETFTISGLIGTQTGRIAFQTFYPSGGFGGPNGDTVGLATVTYTATAQTALTWTGATNGSWNNSGNWSPAQIPASNIDNQFTFAATPNPLMSNNIAGTLVLNSMTFNAGAPAYTLSGNGLNFQTNSSAAPPQIVTNSANSVTISTAVTLTNNLTVSGTGNLALNGAIGGAGSLTMSGSGTLTLGNGANTYAGGTNVLNGTVQAPNDAALGTGNITGATLGTVAFTGTTTTAKSFAMNLGTIAVAAGQTVTFNGGPVSGATLDGAGTFATDATNGARFVGVTASPSVAIAANSANDQFVHFTNGGALTVPAGINIAGTSTTVTFNGFTNQGLGSMMIGAGSQVNVANFQSYGKLTLNPTTAGQTTLLTNVGSSPLGFSAGSRTFIDIPSAGANFTAGMDLHGQNLIVAGGLFVNNGFVADSTATPGSVIVDYGSLYKGAGATFVPIITQNGGKFQAGNSPGTAVFAAVTIGPGQLNTFDWQINDAGPSPTHPNAPGVTGGGSGNPVSGWSLLAAEKIVNPINIHIPATGNLTWTATSSPGNQFDFQLETLLGPTTPVGSTTDGPMSDFDPTLRYLWPFISFQGTYTGPTDDATLTADTLIDVSQFQNPYAGTFSLHFDAANKSIDLVYTPVPEPGTLGLVAVGLLGVWRYRRRGR